MDPRLLCALQRRSTARDSRKVSGASRRRVEQRPHSSEHDLPACLRPGFSLRCQRRLPMRALIGLIGFSLVIVATDGLAEPKAAPGYEVETVQKSGAIFAGLALDGDVLLVTDLA